MERTSQSDFGVRKHWQLEWCARGPTRRAGLDDPVKRVREARYLRRQVRSLSICNKKPRCLHRRPGRVEEEGLRSLPSLPVSGAPQPFLLCHHEAFPTRSEWLGHVQTCHGGLQRYRIQTA